MDPFDEFEMKPLTAGLGFHKKTVTLSDKIDKSEALKSEISAALPTLPPDSLLFDETSAGTNTDSKTDKETLEDLLSALTPLSIGVDSAVRSYDMDTDGGSLKISPTLPRTKKTMSATHMDIQMPAPMAPPPVTPNIDQPAPVKRPMVRPAKPSEQRAPQTTGVQRGATNSPNPRLTAIAVSIPSVVLDGVIVFALSLVFLVSLLTVTGIDLISVLASSQTDLTTQISMAVLYVAVLQMYVVVTRSFFGKTLAEWTFEFQLGSDQEQAKATYPIRVVWRSILVVMTGVFVLPLISFIIRKDVLAFFTGLQLYKRNY